MDKTHSIQFTKKKSVFLKITFIGNKPYLEKTDYLVQFLNYFSKL